MSVAGKYNVTATYKFGRAWEIQVFIFGTFWNFFGIFPIQVRLNLCL